VKPRTPEVPGDARSAPAASGCTERVASVLSVDVEDWFHILDVPGAPGILEWEGLPSRVEKGTMRLLDIFSEKRVQATFFFLGWIAERHAHLVVEAGKRGHEIASHGHGHRLVYEMTPGEFLQDALRSKCLLEDITGRPVVGYRSAGFSTTERTPWFFDRLAEAGYRYDSSVFPGRRGHGGIRSAPLAPYTVKAQPSAVVEFPISVVEILGWTTCFFGGGYLRLFPYGVIKHMAQRVLGEGRPIIFYIHPREVDPNHPRLAMPLWRRFKSYVNMKTAEPKMRKILDEFEITTFGQYLEQNSAALEGA
jgi:polysaccharide deacetylase family protein (PEP-CTERM system associated)